ncbi:MAG: enoyl-ACP reductase [Pirellulaceae bacterium]|jgi:enoyl-[acyl-carrier protein] reductase I|nr:enoyl-ACP reductase [Pirellulaceae bacterium]MDP7017242.1 enoyl-ACP reductase [Pirellulaceae bacterium]
MGLFEGKKGLILGVANDRSIAWGIAKEIMDQGGECGFSHLPDKPDDDRKKNSRRVNKAIDGHPNAKFVEPLNVSDDDQIAAFMEKSKESFGTIDFLVHSIAFATMDDLSKDTIETSREGFKLAMDISAYSLIAVANAAKPMLNDGAAVLTMTYFGGERCVPGYNVMGICKAALDASVRYLAHDLGPRRIRVNAISAGPLKTLASAAVGAKNMLDLYSFVSPIGGRDLEQKDVAKAAAFLLSDMSTAITAEILHVDNGYNAMGSPGRLLDHVKADS